MIEADITEVTHNQDTRNHLFAGQLPVSLTKAQALLLLLKAFREGLFTKCAVNVWGFSSDP